jgi:hypothetical protein
MSLKHKEVKMRGNPIRDYLDDEKFKLLWEKGFLNERAIRDHYIREKFGELKQELKPKRIIEMLQEEFSYLSNETIRKIVYSRENGMNGFTS